MADDLHGDQPPPTDLIAHVEALRTVLRRAAARPLTPEEQAAAMELAKHLRGLLDENVGQ